MTITFENDNDVIIYALEKSIAYARRTQQIFVAQCVWWLASILGLEQGLIAHIDILQRASRETSVGTSGQRVSVTPRDIPEDSRIHPDRIQQVGRETPDLEEEYDSEPDQQSRVLKEAEQFVSISRQDRKAFSKKKAKDQLSQTRSEKTIAKSLSNKQRKYLQSIPKDTIVE